MIKAKINSKQKYQNIFIHSEDNNIVETLVSIEKINTSYKIKHLISSKHMISSKNIYVVDDSTSSYLNILRNYEKKIPGKIFLLSSDSSMVFDDFKKLKVFYKPFRLFSLYKEISKSISSNKIYYKDWYIEKNKLVSKIDNLILTLTEKEYDLISLLAMDPKKVYEKDDLLKKVWDINTRNKIETRVLESLISRLRRKLKNIKKGPRIERFDKGYRIKI